MNRSNTLSSLIVVLCCLALASCQKDPVNHLINPTASNTAGGWSGVWTIYDDDLKTGGTVMMFTSKDGQQIDFASKENPHTGAQSLKYSWDGTDAIAYQGALQYFQPGYVGFGLIVPEDQSKFGVVTRDLTPGGFTKVSFWIRGNIGSLVTFRLETDNGTNVSPSGNNAWESNTTDRAVTSAWQRYEFALSGSQAATKLFLKIFFKYAGGPGTRGTGGTVYLDDIALTR
jgi:hypothetical protein